MAKYRHLIFDLDGTLLDTIEDIAFAINLALEQCGYPQRFNRESARYLIGDGAEALIRRALKEKGSDLQAFNEIKPIYMELYRIHQVEHAHPYEGLVEVLTKLRDAGFSFYCVTNKPDALAHTILDMHFGKGFFKEILGAKPSLKVKPDPEGVHFVMKKHGLNPEECLYVGDSHVDVETAHNAGLPCGLCLWGYETDYPTYIPKAERTFAKPQDLLLLV